MSGEVVYRAELSRSDVKRKNMKLYRHRPQIAFQEKLDTMAKARFSKSFPALRSSQLESTDRLCKAEGSQPKAKS